MRHTSVAELLDPTMAPEMDGGESIPCHWHALILNSTSKKSEWQLLPAVRRGGIQRTERVPADDGAGDGDDLGHRRCGAPLRLYALELLRCLSCTRCVSSFLHPPMSMQYTGLHCCTPPWADDTVPPIAGPTDDPGRG
jgi:hypothetical protein